MDEEERRPREPGGIGRSLAGMSVDELEDLKAALAREIVRIEEELRARHAAHGAAEALFRRPPPSTGNGS